MPSLELAAEPRLAIAGCDLSFVLIGERLREWREVRKFSECDWEQASRISRLLTARIEDGLAIPDIETLRVYAHVLKIPVTVLLYGEDTPQVNGVWSGFSEFAEMFSLLSWGERCLLRRIALMLPKNTQDCDSDATASHPARDAGCVARA